MTLTAQKKDENKPNLCSYSTRKTKQKTSKLKNIYFAHVQFCSFSFLRTGKPCWTNKTN